MSFTQMKRDELYELAVENFAVDVPETATKPQIIAALAENGVSWDMAKVYDKNAAAIAAEEEVTVSEGVILSEHTKANGATVVEETPVVVVEKPVVAPAPEVVLMKMDRENPTYQIRGYKFTRQNPFAVVSADDADYILNHEDGFKIASPREAKEYYG